MTGITGIGITATTIITIDPITGAMTTTTIGDTTKPFAIGGGSIIATISIGRGSGNTGITDQRRQECCPSTRSSDASTSSWMQPSSMARMLLWWKDLPHSLRRPARSKLRTGRPVVYAVRDTSRGLRLWLRQERRTGQGFEVPGAGQDRPSLTPCRVRQARWREDGS